MLSVLVALTIQVCYPQAYEGQPPQCFPFKVVQFQTSELCKRAIDQGLEAGTWLQAAKIFQVPSGYVLRFDCSPDLEIEVE